MTDQLTDRQREFIDLQTRIKKLCTSLRLATADFATDVPPGEEPTEADLEKMSAVEKRLVELEAVEKVGTIPFGDQDVPLYVAQERKTFPSRWFPVAVSCVVVLSVVTYLSSSRGTDPSPKTGPPEIIHCGTLNADFRLIPSGRVTMGSSSDEQALIARHVNHTASIRLTGELRKTVPVSSFYMCTTEVTVRQFREFAETTSHILSSDTRPGIGRCDGIFKRGDHFTWQDLGDIPSDDRHPVTNVSWRDAVAFAEWLSEKERTTYRLPTEAEWEWAAQSGSRFRWQTGNSHRGALDVGWCAENSRKQPHPVGFKPASTYGLHDMHGNVWEWCSDHVDSRRPQRVMRGGSYRTSVWMARSAARSSVHEKHLGAAVGFRLVKQITGKEMPLSR
tara:strand:+ start:15273 stop:16445 length:1173 start_codon:yes stop_codon:yes gene_type:complete